MSKGGRPPDSQMAMAKQLFEEKAKHQAELKTLDSRAEARVEEKIRKGQGPLYAKLRKDIEDKYVEEAANDATKVKKELQVEADKKIADEISKLSEHYDSQVALASKKFLENVAEARIQWETERGEKEIDKLVKLKQAVLNAETAEMEAKKTLTSAVAAEREASAERVAALHADVVGHIDRALMDHRDETVSMLDDRLQRWHSTFEHEVESRNTGGSKLERNAYEKLERLKEIDVKARSVLGQGFEKELRTVETTFREQERATKEATDSIERSYQLQLHALGSTLELQQTAYGNCVDALEDALGSKYNTLLIALKEKSQLEQESQMKRAISALSRQAQLEVKQSRQAVDEQQRATEAAAATFHGMLGEIRNQWDAEQKQRSLDTETRMKTHYEELVAGMRSQAELAIELMHLQDEQWVRDSRLHFQNQMSTMEEFKAKCQRLYGARLEEVGTKLEANLQKLQADLLDSAEVKTQLRNQHELSLRRQKRTFAKHKADYQIQTEGTVKKITEELEEKYVVKYTEALDELSKMRETNMATDRRRIAAEAELQKVLAAQASKASEQRRENVKSEQSSSYGREMLSILQKQWDENGTPASGKYEFMVKLMDKIDGFGPQLTEGIESELEMAHVSSVIARLHKRFGVLDSALKGFDDNIKTLEKQTKFIPMQQVAEINKTIESSKQNRSSTLRQIRAAAYHLAKLVSTFKRCYQKPLSGGPSSADEITEQIKPWLVMSAGQGGVGLEDSWYHQIEFTTRAMSGRMKGSDVLTHDDWVEMEKSLQQSEAESPSQSPPGPSGSSPATSPRNVAKRGKGTSISSSPATSPRDVAKRGKGTTISRSPASPPRGFAKTGKEVKSVSAVLGSWGFGQERQSPTQQQQYHFEEKAAHR